MQEVLCAFEWGEECAVSGVYEGGCSFGAGFVGPGVAVWVGEGLELEEFGAEGAGVDCEGAGGGGARGEGFGEEVVVYGGGGVLWWWWFGGVGVGGRVAMGQVDWLVERSGTLGGAEREVVGMTLGGGCEGYVALEGGEEAIAVAEGRLLRHLCGL